jgi:hypothetical protein
MAGGRAMAEPHEPTGSGIIDALREQSRQAGRPASGLWRAIGGHPRDLRELVDWRRDDIPPPAVA